MAKDLETQGLQDQLKGKIHEFTGSMTGDTAEEMKGKGENVLGKADQKTGEIKRQWENTPPK